MGWVFFLQISLLVILLGVSLTPSTTDTGMTEYGNAGACALEGFRFVRSSERFRFVPAGTTPESPKLRLVAGLRSVSLFQPILAQPTPISTNIDPAISSSKTCKDLVSASFVHDDNRLNRRLQKWALRFRARPRLDKKADPPIRPQKPSRTATPIFENHGSKPWRLG